MTLGAAAIVAGCLACGWSIYSGARHLQKLSTTDSLTDLPNRRALHEDIKRLEVRDQEVALALIDLDGFKDVNDHYSHFVGDAIIRECAGMLRAVAKEEARCYRLGGDEFALLLSGPLAGTIAEGMCRGFIERLTMPIVIGDRRIVIGASIGLTRARPEQDLSSSELLRQADIAMYASKRSGRMRCTWFSPHFDISRESTRALDQQLRQALASDQLAIHYQPLVDARDQSIVAVEALLRWTRPDGESVSPSVFIPVAEESGLINDIGLWVLRRACSDALPWEGITLSINISAAQLRNTEFPINLGQILEETGFPPERLELEITETSLVLDPVTAERTLDVIRGFGVNVALDDFGTGYASIGFLRKFRFQKLKIDRSLVVEAEEDAASRAMMLSSITVARAMNMDVTAEGVETEAQAALVRAAGCDQIQGWLYFRAMPAAQIETLRAVPAPHAAIAGVH
ncbi:bifunctional diguanylate cyclase/phosphodiesterase [Erythrobacteraceae bacterium CFH 75059]|nr:bifunctional diguanylate cyclase/phosphodiesterase [Erythrobacteraceae bacterium CFH 75059]